MLTPKFKLEQNDDTLTVVIFAQFARVSDTEISAHKDEFLFVSSPYYLRLNLPGNLQDSELEVPKATYDGEKGLFCISCKKETPGMYFAGLDMLTDLLTPKGGGISKPLIEVIDGSEAEVEEEEEELDWFYEQKLPVEEILGYKYGFGHTKTGFTTVRDELFSIVDIVDPDGKSPSVRQEERISKENEDFNDDHYLADLFEKDSSYSYMQFKPSFYNTSTSEVEYCIEDEETLLKLPRKEFLIDGNKSYIYLSLVDIIFAWCYNHRITLGENCSESAWNISKLSSTLSWLDSFHNLKEVSKSSIRRSLIYPLVRNWELSNIVLQDTTQIFSLGRKQVLKCLLEVHRVFNSYDPYYLLNQFYITDYCVWIQTVKEEKLSSLADSLKKISYSKEDMNLELVELESAAQTIIEEEKSQSEEEKYNLNNIVDSLDQLAVIENNFALSKNDNDNDQETPIRNVDFILPINDNSSSDSDSSSEDSDSNSSDSDSSSDSSSSSGSEDLD